jgi:glycosyltransferase involved in cell wall biosynthesis
MRILVDATPVSDRVKGTARFLLGLLAALPTAAGDDEVLAVTWPEGQRQLAGCDVEVHVEPTGSSTVWEYLRLPRSARRLAADVIFTLREFVAPISPPTLMHLAEPPEWRLKQPSTSAKHRAKNRLLASTIHGSLRRAARITTSSVATAEWVERTLGQAPRVIEPGINGFFLEADSVISDPPAPFLLHPCTGDVRENTPLVLAAYQRSAARSDGIRLALVGSELDPSLRQQLAARGLVDDTDILGWVDDVTLRHLYATTAALVHPSRFEGYVGLQVLEAMAQGAPVIALRAPGVSDSLGGEAFLVDGSDSSTLAGAIDQVTHASELRARLSSAGRTLAARHTWEAAARAFVEELRIAAGVR